MTFITSERGKPCRQKVSRTGFARLAEAVVDDEGKRLLPDGLSPHGLRKATCRRLAKAGGSAHDIMSVSGHQTPAEATRYTVAANRRHLANGRLRRWNGKKREQGLKTRLAGSRYIPVGH